VAESLPSRAKAGVQTSVLTIYMYYSKKKFLVGYLEPKFDLGIPRCQDRWMVGAPSSRAELLTTGKMKKPAVIHFFFK
jgi:hypothetical protein